MELITSLEWWIWILIVYVIVVIIIGIREIIAYSPLTYRKFS